MGMDLVALIAVVVAAIASMGLGMFWYGTNGFGKQWMKAVGMSAASLKKAQKQGMGGTMTVAFITTALTAYVLWWVFTMTGAGDLSTMLQYATVLWLGFNLPLAVGPVLWEQKPKELAVINGGYQLVSLMVMTIVISLF